MIDVKNLTISFNGVCAVENVSFSIEDGEIVGVVGESGSGKSVTALTMMGLVSDSAVVESGSITFDQKVIVEAGKKRDDSLLRQYQGSRMSMVFQEPMTSLNPTMRVGKQVEEVLRLHTDLKGDVAKERIVDIFKEVGLKNPEELYSKYPHELSGGMRQRVMIAMALVLEPQLIIADEPTTALDVTIQAQIIELLKEINERHHNSMMFITHDLNLARNLASKLIVMHNGRIVETGTPEEIFTSPKKDYTKMLISAVPQRKRLQYSKSLGAVDEKREEVLAVRDLNVYYKEGNHLFSAKRKNQKHAVKNVDFSMYKGEILGLVGESGCGKTSLSRAIVGLNNNYTGQIQHFTERPQMIFQDPYSSLNPAKTVGWLLEEPLRVRGERGGTLKEAAVEMLRKVGLNENFYNRRPSELSGGQRQRISIGQALITRPQFVIADEPVSALDVTIQAQIMDLMMELKEDMGLSYLFISHDINIVYQISDRIMVMRDGSIVEIGQTHQIFDAPKDEYTKILLA